MTKKMRRFYVKDHQKNTLYNSALRNQQRNYESANGQDFYSYKNFCGLLPLKFIKLNKEVFNMFDDARLEKLEKSK